MVVISVLTLGCSNKSIEIKSSIDTNLTCTELLNESEYLKLVVAENDKATDIGIKNIVLGFVTYGIHTIYNTKSSSYAIAQAEERAKRIDDLKVIRHCLYDESQLAKARQHAKHMFVYKE